MIQRLQKIMAQAGLGSRRENESWIAAGRVRVNGQLAKLGDKADPETDTIEVDGKKINATANKYIYIMLNKPKGVLSSTTDELEEGRETVLDLVPDHGHLYPVGRLDKPSEGLILLTNDGNLAHKLTHPKYGHEKSYRALISGKINNTDLEAWRNGVELEGKMTAPAKIFVMNKQKDRTLLRILLKEGRKRQIRRVASLLGYNVLYLQREAIGPLQLGGLQAGQWRYLSEEEVQMLKETVRKTRAQKPSYEQYPTKDNEKSSTDKKPARFTDNRTDRNDRTDRKSPSKFKKKPDYKKNKPFPSNSNRRGKK